MNKTTSSSNQGESLAPAYNVNLLIPQPMSVGRILDRSLKLFPQLLTVIWPFYLILALFPTLQQMPQVQANWVLSLVLSFVFLVVSYPLSLLTIFLCAAIWVNEEITLRSAWKRVTYQLIGKTISQGIIIATLSSLGFLLLVIPGVVYYVNRLLAFYVLTLENQSIKFSLQKSRHLMTREAWWKPSGPLIRINGVLLFFMISYSLLSFLSGILAALSIQESFPFSNTALFAVQYLLGLMSMLIPLLHQLCFVGFYFDLRSRYEALDLFVELDKVRASINCHALRSAISFAALAISASIYLSVLGLTIGNDCAIGEDMPVQATGQLNDILKQESFQPRRIAKSQLLSEIAGIVFERFQEWMKSLKESGMLQSKLWQNIAEVFSATIYGLKLLFYPALVLAVLYALYRLSKILKKRFGQVNPSNEQAPAILSLGYVRFTPEQLRVFISEKQWLPALVLAHQMLRERLLMLNNLPKSTTDRELIPKITNAQDISKYFFRNAELFEELAYAQRQPTQANLSAHLDRALDFLKSLDLRHSTPISREAMAQADPDSKGGR